MDALGKLVVEIRDDDAVTAIAHGRVRGAEPAGATTSDAGDARGPGEYVAFVVLSKLDDPRVGPRIPAHRAVIAARCYGRTFAEAAALRWAVSQAIHLVGPRLKSNGLGIYQSLDESGGAADRDPNTQQPYETFVMTALATTVVVTP